MTKFKVEILGHPLRSEEIDADVHSIETFGGYTVLKLFKELENDPDFARKFVKGYLLNNVISFERIEE